MDLDVSRAIGNESIFSQEELVLLMESVNSSHYPGKYAELVAGLKVKLNEEMKKVV